MTIITKTFVTDSEETKKELRYSLAHAYESAVSFRVEKDKVIALFTDESLYQSWIHAHKQWFDKEPVELGN